MGSLRLYEERLEEWLTPLIRFEPFEIILF